MLRETDTILGCQLTAEESGTDSKSRFAIHLNPAPLLNERTGPKVRLSDALKLSFKTGSQLHGIF
jgi:hypothetical protein